MIFLGTVIDALQYRDDRVVRARMHIDRAYKGVSEITLDLFDDGMCDGPDLQVGEQYLMYTWRGEDGRIPSRGCSRSRHVKYAEEDLKFLNGLGDASPLSRVFGKVMARTDDYYGKEQPAVAATVELTGPDGKRTTTTDGDGRYIFDNLTPATYTVQADLAGHRMLIFTHDGKLRPTDVEARGCAVVDLAMRRTWQGAVAGRVIKSHGEPAPAGITMNLIRIEDHEGRETAHHRSDQQLNEQGEYVFLEVSPGRYKIVMNPYSFPTADAPYPAIYWPNSRAEADALVIEVTDSAAQARYDFQLPPEPKGRRVSGVVIAADGKALARARVHISSRLGVFPGIDEYTDDDGRFSFTAFEGFDYRSVATGQDSYSSALSCVLGKTLPFGTLVVDRPGQFDWSPKRKGK